MVKVEMYWGGPTGNKAFFFSAVAKKKKKKAEMSISFCGGVGESSRALGQKMKMAFSPPFKIDTNGS